MTPCNTLNIKLSNLQLNKLKFGIKNNTELTFIKILSDIVGDSNDESNFSYNLLLTKLLQMIPQLM